MFKWIQEKFLGWIVIKIVKAALAKADVKPYAVLGATVTDKYLDKYLGEKTSEEIQNEVVGWIQSTVNAFSDELRQN